MAECVEQREYKYGEKLTEEILTAEFYNLQQYLTACIGKASAFSYKAFTNDSKFNAISGDSKSKIFLNMCKEMEIRIDQCVQEMEVNTKHNCTFCNSQRRFGEAKNKFQLIRKASGPRFWVLK